MKTMKAVKKPIPVSCVQLTPDNVDEVVEWINEVSGNPFGAFIDDIWNDGTLIIETLEGEHIAHYGDYIICGVDKEFYPVKESIFKKTYEIKEAEQKIKEEI